MDVYLYQAALYCDDCGKAIRGKLAIPPGADIDNEHTFDSNDYPKGPYSDGGGEADCPQHCDACNVFLENSLTGDGVDYVREMLRKRPNGKTAKHWADFYGISIDD